ncbi:MAG: hypothetical protein AB1649_28760 [Chloroflexota bacterium]
MKKALLALSILILASLACQTLTGGTSEPPVTIPTSVPPINNPTSVPPVNNPTSAPPSGGGGAILFQDDFSDSSSGWPHQVGDSDKAAEYSNGQYLVRAITAYQDVWAHPGLSFSDVSIEVDATKSNGPDDNNFGLICRFVDDGNFYFFWVSSDGFFAIGKYQNGESSLISGDSMLATSAMNAGNVTNHLRADCVGSALTLYANGELLSTVTDSSFSSGDIGVMVGTFEQPDLGILFDNFVVRAP